MMNGKETYLFGKRCLDSVIHPSDAMQQSQKDLEKTDSIDIPLPIDDEDKEPASITLQTQGRIENLCSAFMACRSTRQFMTEDEAIMDYYSYVGIAFFFANKTWLVHNDSVNRKADATTGFAITDLGFYAVSFGMFGNMSKLIPYEEIAWDERNENWHGARIWADPLNNIYAGNNLIAMYRKPDSALVMPALVNLIRHIQTLVQMDPILNDKHKTEIARRTC